MTRCHIKRKVAPDCVTQLSASAATQGHSPLYGTGRRTPTAKWKLATPARDQLALGAKPVLLVIPTLALIDLEGAGRDLFLGRLEAGARLGSRSCRGRILGGHGLGSRFDS